LQLYSSLELEDFHQKRINHAHEMFYLLLTEGIVPVTGQLTYLDASNSDVDWKPKLPESVVAKFAMKVAQNLAAHS